MAITKKCAVCECVFPVKATDVKTKQDIRKNGIYDGGPCQVFPSRYEKIVLKVRYIKCPICEENNEISAEEVEEEVE